MADRDELTHPRDGVHIETLALLAIFPMIEFSREKSLLRVVDLPETLIIGTNDPEQGR